MNYKRRLNRPFVRRKSRFVDDRYIKRDLNIVSPTKLNYTHSIRDFIDQIYEVKRAGFEDVIIDFSKLDSAEHSYFPNIIVPMAVFIDFFKEKFNFDFHFINADKGLEHTNLINPQHAAKSNEYSSVLNKIWYFDSPEDVFKLVTEYMDAIYKVDSFSSEDVLNWLEWCLNEVMDNVIQHSEADRGFIMGQVHPTTKHMAFCIGDSGRGIYSSLRTSREFFPHDAADALVLALKEGVTRDKNVGQGNGLWGLHEVAIKSSGKLRLASSGKILFVDEEGQTYSYPFLNYHDKNGTVVDFQLDYSTPIVLTEILNGYKPESMKIFMSTSADDDRVVDYNLQEQKSGFGTRKSGERIRNEVRNMLLSADKVNINFTGINMISSSFADELIGKMYVELGPIYFTQRVQLSGMNETVQAIVNKAVIQRMSQAESKKSNIDLNE